MVSGGVGCLCGIALCGIALGCTPLAGDPAEPTTSTERPTAATAAAPTCATCAEAPAASSAAAPLEPYEPELAELPPEMTTDEAASILRAVQALGARGDATCVAWRKPLGTRCEATDDVLERAGAWAARMPEGSSLVERRRASEELARLEGCRQVPKGALRWLRIHHLEQCGVELATPVLGQGGPELDPTVRGLLVGEVIAETCQRLVEPMPVYHGEYTPERFQESFEQWRVHTLQPWHRHVLGRLEACHDVAARLPAGAPGRAAASLGYARAVAKFAGSHRGAPLDERLIHQYDARTAYLAALDDVTAAFDDLRDAANDEARREAARQGDYDSAVRGLAPVLVRREPLSLLGLPPLPPVESLTLAQPSTSSQEADTDGAAHRVLSRLPVHLSPLLANTTPPSVEEGAAHAWLSALLRRGLPQVIRAQLGATLSTISPDASERQRLHGLLGAGLVRLGLVTQDLAMFERAAYELAYAEPNVETAWLGAVTRAVLSSARAQHLIPRFRSSPGGHGDSAQERDVDVSGFTPELLRIAETEPAYASLAVDHAVLSVTLAQPNDPRDAASRVHHAVRMARRPGVPDAQRRCINDWAAACGWQTDDVRSDCACTPFPWRIEARAVSRR